MTHALLTASLRPEALLELERDFNWEITQLPSGTELRTAARDHANATVLVVEGECVDAPTIDAFPKLSLIACLRGSPVNVDIKHATARSIPVLHTPGRNAESAADLVLGLIYSCLRHVATAHHMIVSGVLTEDREERRGRQDVIWRPSEPGGIVPYTEFKGPELSRLTLGLLGFGAIGRRVAAKAIALEMRVLVHDPFVADEAVREAGASPVHFDRLFIESDVVSLHAPSQNGPPLVGARELGLMKETAYLINTARATVLDYNALVDALREGRLRGAGLDVFPDEPLSAQSPFLKLSNVTLTPHIAGASVNVVDHQSEILLYSLRALAAGDSAKAFVRNLAALERLPSGIPPAVAHAASHHRTYEPAATRRQG
jgi:D-3-phosphoglycerate dehydrogenase